MILFLDVLASFFMVVMGSVGFRRGFIEEMGRLLGLIISTLFALNYYLDMAGLILSIVSVNTFVIMVISFAIIFALMLFITRVLTRFFHILLTSSGTKFANRSMGFLFGAVKGMIILMLLYWTVDLFPEKKWAAIIREESYLSKTFTDTRHVIIDIFHLNDPVHQGELFIQDVIKRDRAAGGQEI
jgi:membrane protein required for colicin V production